MLWRKPADMKYTDMCIWIDENIPKIGAHPGEYPDIEDTVYNYLYLLTKALAIKKRMFQNFEDYDGYAFYAASRLFTAIRKNYQNQGKTIKGKVIRPIKSCLNYTKTLLYPMKVEYMRETFAQVISEEFTSKQFDAFSFKEHLKDYAEQSQSKVSLQMDLTDTIYEIGYLIDQTLAGSPFHRNQPEWKKLKITLLLNFLYGLNTTGAIDWNPVTVLLWKLPKSLTGYVRILLVEFYTLFKDSIMECFTVNSMDDELLTKLISSPDGTFKEEYEDD